MAWNFDLNRPRAEVDTPVMGALFPRDLDLGSDLDWPGGGLRLPERVT